ncbi:MAG: nitrite/sulfite reductase [Sulfurimonas sp.]|nr:nitrite/sulfite reductase [Sulfurimonas sp.]
MAKETAAQRVERIKKEKSGLEVLKDIHHYATSGNELNPEDIDRFKWYGLYTQNKNLQADDDKTQYFMLRVKLVQGSMNLEQIRAVSAIAKEFARGTVDFTTRQDVQFHFIQVCDLPEIFSRLKNVGLSTVFAAGDVPRNVATCPVAGVDKSEIYDVRNLVEEIHNYFNGNRDLVNLPRKYKVGMSGCSKHCMGHEIQDLSFSAVKKDNKILFDVSVGGGLASNKQFAQHIGYALPEQVLDIVKSITIIYRDHGLRENRRKARLGHLISAWGLEKFKAEVENSLGFKLKDESAQKYTPYSKREHFGIYNSKDDALSYIGCAINGGVIGDKSLSNLADILEKNGASTIKATPTQNFVILDVPNENSENLVKELSNIGIDANPNPFKARTLSCTGIKFCKFAISETKDSAISLVNYLHNKFPEFNETVSISVNGCPNSCAHPLVVDIGLLGTKFKNKNGETVAGFELILGGNLEGDQSSFGKKTGVKLVSEDAGEIVGELIEDYLQSDYKNFHEYVVGRVDE